jgi:hypothetical protein
MIATEPWADNPQLSPCMNKSLKPGGVGCEVLSPMVKYSFTDSSGCHASTRTSTFVKDDNVVVCLMKHSSSDEARHPGTNNYDPHTASY